MTDGRGTTISTQSDGEDANCVEVAWRRSSYSDGEGAECVEVCACQEAVHVRDSKNSGDGELVVPPTAWNGFVAFAAYKGVSVATWTSH
jgi:hypothetical protein